MSMGKGMKALYPNADHIRDYMVMDNSDGRGPYLAYFDEAKLGARPALSAILGAAEAQDLETAREQTREAALRAEMRLLADTLEAGTATSVDLRRVVVHLLRQYLDGRGGGR